jgi:hypothetical protein
LRSRGIGPTEEPKHLYDYPVYYETAFSFRDIHREAEVFDECIRQYSRVPVRRVLELGAGTAAHMEEWASRKIEYVGIDPNENMLDYARRDKPRRGRRFSKSTPQTRSRFFGGSSQPESSPLRTVFDVQGISRADANLLIVLSRTEKLKASKFLLRNSLIRDAKK